tara:strand:- start:9851 stop:10111 length:261 start_codon:yes stop_codon:yes gene_type:complete
MKIVLDIKEQEIVLTMEEAKKLHQELELLFAKKNETHLHYPYGHRGITTPYSPFYDGNNFHCNTGDTILTAIPCVSDMAGINRIKI